MSCINVTVNPAAVIDVVINPPSTTDIIVNPYSISSPVTQNQVLNLIGESVLSGQFNIIGIGLIISVSGNNIIISPSGVSANINYMKTTGTSGILSFNNGFLTSYT